MGWRGVKTLGVFGVGLLLAGGCDSTDFLSSGLKTKKKKDAGVAMDAGADAGGSDAGADGSPPEDAGTAMEDGCAGCPANLPPTVSAGDDQLTDEGSTVTLTATASDPENDPLAYQWTFRTDPQPNGAPVNCTLGTANALSTSFTCDNDVVAFAKITVADGHNAAVSDEVRVQFRNVIATAAWLSPPDGALIKKDTLMGPMIEIHDPAPVDALACLLFRDDDMETNTAFFPPTRMADGRSTCNFPPTNYLTELTGMRSLHWQVAMQDQQDVGGESRIVVWDPNPAEVTNGQGQMPACTSQATLAFAAHYPSTEATVPDGYFRLDDAAAGMQFRSTGLDWFVISRVRPSLPPDRAAIAGRGKNGDRECTFLLFVRGPDAFEFDQGARSGQARAQIHCGEVLYDTVMTDPFGILDVDRSALSTFTSGSVHLGYPHVPGPFFNRCADPEKEGLDCTNGMTAHVQSGVCHAGQCVITCQPGDATSTWGDCDGIAENGCETDLAVDSASCGTCGSFCAGDCVQKVCQSGP